jgi:hypothetical protein
MDVWNTGVSDDCVMVRRPADTEPWPLHQILVAIEFKDYYENYRHISILMKIFGSLCSLGLLWLLVRQASSAMVLDGLSDSSDHYDMHPKSSILPLFTRKPRPIIDSQDLVQYYANLNDTDADGWWEVTYNDHHIFEKLRNRRRLFLRRSDVDLNSLHSCYEYKVCFLAVVDNVA